MTKAKKQERKLYKCVRKAIDGDRNFLAVKFKNLSTTDIREVKTEINALLEDFWEEPDEDSVVRTRESEVQFEQGTKR